MDGDVLASEVLEVLAILETLTLEEREEVMNAL